MAVDRERFQPAELAVVLSHYDIGVIESAKDYPRGSRRSPKLLLQTARGRYLLKRRATGRDDPFRVAFTHALLAHLGERKLPVPALVGTRDDNNSLLHYQGRVYELFEYVAGQRYDGSLDETGSAGGALAAFHRAVRDLTFEYSPGEISYHDAAGARAALNAIPTTTSGHDSVAGHEADLLRLTQELYERYDEAAAAARAEGLEGWPRCVVHGDWHPGNMLFVGGRVAAILDLDAARLQPPVMDVAYGMLQFSILRGDSDPEDWPAYFDEARMRRFFVRYAQRTGLPREQRLVIPGLMVQALIAECTLPIAATGSFGRLPGYTVLQMVGRKVRWLLANAERMRGWLSE